MSDTCTVGLPSDDAEVAALAAILAQVFTIAEGPAGARAWLDRVGLANARAVRHDGVVAGGLIVIPMGQWFGGRSVPMAGIAAVGIAPEHRSRGAATALMRETLRGLRADGFPISALYPATQALYRRVGFERAGVQMWLSVPAKAIDVHERGLPMRRAGDADRPAIEACYAERARGSAGLLDRGPYIWNRVRGTKEPSPGYVVEEAGRVTGYVHYAHRQTPDGVPDIVCSDVVATTPGAARRLLGFFAEHRSLAGKISWIGGPADPLQFHLGEQRDADAEVNFWWMLRLLDVAAAFTARGFPVGLTAELHFDVTDDLFPENAGRWTVRIQGGRADVTRGGRGTLRCDVRGLAALYTGHLAPADAVACGALDGPAGEVAAAAAALAGPLPWMADHF